MRESSPNPFAKTLHVSVLKREAKSLFRKILAISPYSSRFCPDRLISVSGNSNEVRILGECRQKNVMHISNSDPSLSTATALFSSQLRALVDTAENPPGGN